MLVVCCVDQVGRGKVISTSVVDTVCDIVEGADLCSIPGSLISLTKNLRANLRLVPLSLSQRRRGFKILVRNTSIYENHVMYLRFF